MKNCNDRIFLFAQQLHLVVARISTKFFFFFNLIFPSFFPNISRGYPNRKMHLQQLFQAIPVIQEIGEFQENAWKCWILWRVLSQPPKSQILTFFGKKLQNISYKTFRRKIYFAHFRDCIYNLLFKVAYFTFNFILYYFILFLNWFSLGNMSIEQF